MYLKQLFDRVILYVESQYKHLEGIYYSLSEIPDEIKELNVYKEIKQFFDANGVCIHINQISLLNEAIKALKAQNLNVNGIEILPFLYELKEIKDLCPEDKLQNELDKIRKKITASEAKQLRLKSLRSQEMLALQKLETIYRNIKAKANVGESYYFYPNLICKKMATELWGKGFELRFRQPNKKHTTHQITGVNNEAVKTYPILTLEDYKRNDKYSSVYILWDEI